MWFLLWSIHGLSLSLLRSGRVVLSDYHRDVCILCASGEWSFSFFPIPYACSFLLAPKDRRLALSWWSFSVPPMELFDGFSPFLYFLKDILSFDGPYDGPYSMVPSHEQHFLGSLHALLGHPTADNSSAMLCFDEGCKQTGPSWAWPCSNSNHASKAWAQESF